VALLLQPLHCIVEGTTEAAGLRGVNRDGSDSVAIRVAKVCVHHGSFIS
jgi:hypothetical protein